MVKRLYKICDWVITKLNPAVIAVIFLIGSSWIQFGDDNTLNVVLLFMLPVCLWFAMFFFTMNYRLRKREREFSEQLQDLVNREMNKTKDLPTPEEIEKYITKTKLK